MSGLETMGIGGIAALMGTALYLDGNYPLSFLFWLVAIPVILSGAKRAIREHGQRQ